MEKLRKKAMSHGATDFGPSKVKGKRYYIVYQNRVINFGLKNANTYIDHHDEVKRAAWRARHSKIKLKDGRYAYKVKTQSSYWAWHILWP